MFEASSALRDPRSELVLPQNPRLDELKHEEIMLAKKTNSNFLVMFPAVKKLKMEGLIVQPSIGSFKRDGISTFNIESARCKRRKFGGKQEHRLWSRSTLNS